MMETSFWRLMEQGGVVMLPLLLCSVVSLTVILERSWTLTRDARAGRRLRALVQASLSEGGRPEAVAVCRHDASPLGAVYQAVLTSPGGDDASRAALAERRLAHVARHCKRYVWLLGTIGSLAPFIGLLGTVVGIIRAFESMAATGSGGFAIVASGISEALVATAGGLIVGVISIFAYNAIMVRINDVVAELREHTDELLATLSLPASRAGALSHVARPRE